MSWSWRTKPRSIIRTIQWFPYFAALSGENWDEKGQFKDRLGNAIHPVRRTYTYNAHCDNDEWLSNILYNDYLSGKYDPCDKESNGRNDKTTFEFYGFGYVNKTGEVCVSEVGNKIVAGTFDNEDYLKQLLKLRLPNFIYKERHGDGKCVFPFKLILQAFQVFDSLNRSELAILFGCNDGDNFDVALQAIAEFKNKYEKIENKNNLEVVQTVFEKVFKKYYGGMGNQSQTYYEYAEALSRTLIYTGLFVVSGRSIASKIKVAEYSKLKIEMLQEKFDFQYPDNIKSLDEYMEWYGSAHNVKLPWENVTERRRIISEKADILLQKNKIENKSYEISLSKDKIDALVKKANKNFDNGDLKEIENVIGNAIVSVNEEYFVKVLSKTETERKNILEKFTDILGNDDMSALWLEVNTWKSLIAIDGEQIVKRNFKIEEDLTPRSFAPGVGNTPDMELYKNGYIIIPEVSLMTGVRQWEHEASSVIDHVLRFIEGFKDKQVIGLFLSSKINIRTVWQLFILNKESWVGAPVPVVPLTISQYIEIIKNIYDKNLTIDSLKLLFDTILQSATTCNVYKDWEEQITEKIAQWKNE